MARSRAGLGPLLAGHVGCVVIMLLHHVQHSKTRPDLAEYTHAISGHRAMWPRLSAFVLVGRREKNNKREKEGKDRDDTRGHAREGKKAGGREGEGRPSKNGTFYRFTSRQAPSRAGKLPPSVGATASRRDSATKHLAATATVAPVAFDVAPTSSALQPCGGAQRERNTKRFLLLGNKHLAITTCHHRAHASTSDGPCSCAWLGTTAQSCQRRSNTEDTLCRRCSDTCPHRRLEPSHSTRSLQAACSTRHR